MKCRQTRRIFLSPQGLLNLICLSLGMLTSSAHGGDFTICSLGKGLYYDQTTGRSPELRPFLPYLLNAEIDTVAYPSILARVHTPDGRDLQLTQPESYPAGPFYFWGRATDQAGLDSTYPKGTYVFEISTQSPVRQWVTNLLLEGQFPNAPTIANLAEAQAVDAGADFTLTWSPFAGGRPQDYVRCELRSVGSNVFSSPFFGTAGALTGTNDSVLIPAGTLQPGRAYFGRLVFAATQRTFTNEQARAIGTTCYFSQTDFWLRTQGPGDNSPLAVAWTSPTNGATAVATNAPMVLHFNKPMKALGVDYFEAGPSGIRSVSYSGDGLEMTLSSEPSFAGDHTLVLQPFYGRPLVYGDASGNPLPADTMAVYFNVGSYVSPTPARLDNPILQAGGITRIDLHGLASHPYAIECSPDFKSWVALATNIAFYGTAHFSVSNSAQPGKAMLFRGVAR